MIVQPANGSGKKTHVSKYYLPLTAVLGAFLIVLFALLSYLLVALWPPDVNVGTVNGSAQQTAAPAESTGTSQTAQQAAPREVKLFWGRGTFEFTPSEEQRLLLLVMVAAALGSFVHIGTSFATYVGNREFRSQWSLWYGLRAPIGVALAVVFFLLIRGGLFNPGSDSTAAINPFGLVAIAAVIGLFAIEAADKLHDIFDNLFLSTKKVTRDDPLPETHKTESPPPPPPNA
jgi:hypothetical protein